MRCHARELVVLTVALLAAAEAAADRGGSPQPVGRRAPLPSDDLDQQTRAPAPEQPDSPLTDSGPGVAEQLWQQLSNGLYDAVEGWHRSLSRHTSPRLAWLVLASPTLPLLLLLLLLRRRRAPSPPPSRKTAAAQDRAASHRGQKERRSQKDQKDHKDQKDQKERKDRKSEAVAAAPPLDLPRPRMLLLTPDQSSPSLFEVLLGLGIEEDALTALTDSARQQLDAMTWAAAVTEGRSARLQPLRHAWVKVVVLRRVCGWLRAHPLVADQLTVQEPAELDTTGLEGLTLTQADGLGADLSREQQQVLQLARATLADAFDAVNNPYELVRPAMGGIKSLLPQSVFSGPVPCYGVALLLGGLGAVERLRAAGIDVPRIDEFCEAIDEHRQLVNAPVPAEGVAVHALTVLAGGNLPGTGTLMASVAGAAYSTSAVVLRVSKHAGDLDSLAGATLGRVGHQVIEAIEDLESGDGKVLAKNVDELLGIPLLTDESRRVAELARTCERRLSRQPLWPNVGKDEPERPDSALFGLYRALLARATQQSVAAKARMFEILGALASAGTDNRNLSLAERRLGYTIVGLGMPLLRGASTELLSAAREALATLSIDVGGR